MLRCEILDVQGFDPAIHGMRNPKNSWDKSDSVFCPNEYSCDSCSRCEKHECYVSNITIGENDMKLMKTLFNAGTEHRKYDRMIQVWMDIEAPLYWWKEFDTYKVGTVANSCSTMHKIAAKEFTLEDFSCEHMYQETYDLFRLIVDYLNKVRDVYLYGGVLRVGEAPAWFEPKDKEIWWQMIQLLPSSYNQKRTVMMNYEVIARIIEQRSHHKLDEWHQLIDVLGGLPYMQELMK